MMRRLLRLLLGVCLLGQLTMPAAAPAPEYAVKAALLYNFAQLTNWPPQRGDDLILCILGKDPFGQALDDFIGKQVHGMRLGVVRITDRRFIRNCQILYFGESERANAKRILDDVGDLPVLTVTDAAQMVEQGVMIGMQVENNKIVFDLNLSAARRSELVLDPSLLRLARKVY
jgi:hypothetical protein